MPTEQPPPPPPVSTPPRRPRPSSTPLDLLLRAVVPARWTAAHSPFLRLAWPLLEGMILTACALWIATAIQVPQSGFFAVFLAAAGLSGRFEQFLDENRDNIYERRLPSWRANGITTVSVLALFLGMFGAFSASALWLGEARMGEEFRFVLEASRLGNDTILSRRFGSAPALFIYNLLVLLVFFGLAFIYRTYGALLALAWNACVWGLVLAFLVRRGLTASPQHPVTFVLVSAVAVTPHLLLEASAYVIASLGAIYLSKGLMQYGPQDPRLWEVSRAAGVLIALSLGCLFLGAVVESLLPRLVVSLLGS